MELQTHRLGLRKLPQHCIGSGKVFHTYYHVLSVRAREALRNNYYHFATRYLAFLSSNCSDISYIPRCWTGYHRFVEILLHDLPISLELLIPSAALNMADDERRSSKRSRFDQTEPEVKRSSRFDRRSRSPTSRHTESRRSRSPVARKSSFSPSEEKKSSAIDPAAAAGKPMMKY